MKRVSTIGPKCSCGYGMNLSERFTEQSDIDNQIASDEQELGSTLGPLDRARVAMEVRRRNGQMWTQGQEDLASRNQLRQATFLLASHVESDGMCGGPNRNEPARAAKLDYSQRLALAEKVLLAHGGEIKNDEPSMTLEKLGIHQKLHESIGTASSDRLR